MCVSKYKSHCRIAKKYCYIIGRWSRVILFSYGCLLHLHAFVWFKITLAVKVRRAAIVSLSPVTSPASFGEDRCSSAREGTRSDRHQILHHHRVCQNSLLVMWYVKSDSCYSVVWLCCCRRMETLWVHNCSLCRLSMITCSVFSKLELRVQIRVELLLFDECGRWNACMYVCLSSHNTQQD